MVLHKKVEREFQKKIRDVLYYSKANPEVLGPTITQYLKKISKQGLHPLKFYLLEMIDDYLNVYEMTSEQELDEVFDYWSDSEFSTDFMKEIKKHDNILRASEFCLKLFSKHIGLYLDIHLLGKRAKSTKAYRKINEIGDTTIKGKLKTVGFQDVKSIELTQGPYHYLSFLCYDEKNKNKFLKRVAKALEIIKSYSPDSYERFCHFTHTITPVNEKRIVSYSSQKLPGYSTINLYHRDFVDMMDDLIHENGHHHLNCYLNFDELIYEDNDKIYYSPWRRALRPIRGIYHAVFTFYWGMSLFKDLNDKLVFDKINYFKFTDKELLKMKTRFAEEYIMLDYSFYDLKVANKQGKLTKSGLKLIQDLEKNFKNCIHSYKKVMKDIKLQSPQEYKSLVKLQEHLKEMRKLYKF